MKIFETDFDGVFAIELERIEDDRGYFARSWDTTEAELSGVMPKFDDWSFAFNKKAGTLRGLHWQIAPFEEIKLVRCLRGEIWDVVVDVRPNSSSYGKWIGFDLSSQNLNGLYISRGYAHGYITLEDDTLVQYGIHGTYDVASARGARWNDTSLVIDWPMEPQVINKRDATFPDFGD